MTHPSPFDQRTVHTILSRSRRRFLLYHFLENDYANLTEVALQIAAWEDDSSIENVSENLHQRVKISLVHNHLPRLADHDIIEYDARSGAIVAKEGFDKLRPTIKQIQESEDIQFKHIDPESSPEINN